MTCVVDTFVGNGTRQTISLGWEPEYVAIFGSTTSAPMQRFFDGFSGRSHPYTSGIDGFNAIRLTKTGFTVNRHASVNRNGDTFYYLALARSSDLKMALASWMGNGLSGRVITLDDATVDPDMVLVKRDNSRAGVIRIDGQDTGNLSGTALLVTGALTGFAPGEFVVSADLNVNEVNYASDLGEGIDALAIQVGANTVAGTFTGNGAASQAISVGWRPAAVFIYKLSGTAVQARVKVDGMPTDSAAGVNSTTGLLTGAVEISADGFTVKGGTNTNAALYGYTAIRAHGTPPIAAPVVRKSGKKAILLPGSNSRINCGSSDTLAIDGALTIEFLGGVEPSSANVSIPMLTRGLNTEAAGGYSWGLAALYWPGGSGDWPGPEMTVVTGTELQVSDLTVEMEHTWRTGILPLYGTVQHWVITNDGAGKWRLYRNGILVKQRETDLTALDPPIANIDSQSGHYTTIGALRHAGGYINSGRMRFMSSRVYSRDLTASECKSRFLRAGRGSSESDVTSGLVEEWDAANASGSSLPATINAANNGSIVNGSVITI
jgi:hypothetical protein